jgi:hypothetical protein
VSVIAALTVAGSDSGGGAGIQADLRTFAALQVYGTSAITAVTAQSTRGVFAVERLSLSLLRAQLDAVLEDFDIRAAKTGMLADAETVELVAAVFGLHPALPLVVDPVMIASRPGSPTPPAWRPSPRGSSGPRWSPEPPDSRPCSASWAEAVEDMAATGRRLISRARAVLVRAGIGAAIDVLVGAGDARPPGARIATTSTRSAHVLRSDRRPRSVSRCEAVPSRTTMCGRSGSVPGPGRTREGPLHCTPTTRDARTPFT